MVYCQTKSSNTEVEACPGDFVPRDVSSAESAQTSDGADLRVPGVGEVLPAVGHTGAVVQQDGDVDAHDSNDAAAVKVHHEEVLEEERLNLVVHDFDKTEGEHEEDKNLAVHGGEADPELGEGLSPIPEYPRERVQVQ